MRGLAYVEPMYQGIRPVAHGWDGSLHSNQNETGIALTIAF
jgi:hypothetical protein